MKSPADEFRCFLRAAHRRWVVWRILEHAGIGMALASAVALLGVLLLWLLKQPGFTASMTILGIGGVIGIVAGLLNRPTLLQTAMEIDRQLRLHDLFSTAFRADDCRFSDKSWRGTIRALADIEAARHSPSQLICRRLGSRAWGGIGLSAALALTLSLLASNPSLTAGGVSQSMTNARDARLQAVLLAGQPRVQAPQNQRAHDERVATEHSRITSEAGNGTAPHSATSTDQTQSAQSGSGSAAAQSQAASRNDRVQMRNITGEENPTGTSAAGGASGGAEQLGSQHINGSSDLSTRVDAAPWQTSQWPAARATALESVQSGRIDSRYHDLVRAYFDPSSR